MVDAVDRDVPLPADVALIQGRRSISSFSGDALQFSDWLEKRKFIKHN